MFGDTMGFLYANLYNPESVQSRTYDWNGPCQATAPLAPVEWQCDVTPATLASLAFAAACYPKRRHQPGAEPKS